MAAEARPARSAPPLLLLDVDGVLCPLGPGGGEPMIECQAGFQEVRYAAALPERLATLSQSFRLVWATGWGASANAHLTGPFGLPPLPVIDLTDAEFSLGEGWKTRAVREWVGKRPFAWIDDELGDDAHAWAARREVPTLLLDIDASRGLQAEHVDELLVFAERCR